MKILAALDMSKSAEKVLETAVAQTKQAGGALVIMVVAEDFMDIGDYFHVGTGSVAEKMREAAEAAAKDYGAKAAELGAAARVVVEQGPSPADLIVGYAEKENVDVIIMGCRAKKGLDRFLIGSVAAKVVSYAPCSVLVVR